MFGLGLVVSPQWMGIDAVWQGACAAFNLACANKSAFASGPKLPGSEASSTQVQLTIADMPA